MKAKPTSCRADRTHPCPSRQKGSIMRKVFKLQDLDCANCAAKMEAAINKIDGVEKATMSFMTQKLTIVADDARFDAIMDEVERACAKVEPDMEILR
jgi:copper chaperone CopZ